MYVVEAQKQGADLKKISGTIQNDILKEYAARGTYIYPPGCPSMRIITDIFRWLTANCRAGTVFQYRVTIREAGSTAAQELAFTLANGKAYLLAAQTTGLNINTFGKRLSFFFNAHDHFFEEIANCGLRTILGKNYPKYRCSNTECPKNCGFIPNRRLDFNGATTAQQYYPRYFPGFGSRFRRHTKFTHQWL